MARNYFNFSTAGYWPPPDYPDLPPLRDPDPFGIWEQRDQALREDRPVAPPCKVMKIGFQQLRILEVDILDGAWAGSWEQQLMVAQITGDPDRIVSIDLADYRDGLGPVRLPIEIPLSYSEYVRVVYPSLAAAIRASLLGRGPYIPFSVATGGTAEFGLQRVGITELPYSENKHGEADWKVGENILAGSGHGLTYEVTYNVTCSPVFRFGIQYDEVMSEFVEASPVEGQTRARIDMRSVSRILNRLGYAVVADRGSAAERKLEIEGPGDYAAMLEALRPGQI